MAELIVNTLYTHLLTDPASVSVDDTSCLHSSCSFSMIVSANA